MAVDALRRNVVQHGHIRRVNSGTGCPVVLSLTTSA